MRDFSKAKRIVVKVGTNVLSHKGRVDTRFLQVVARQVCELVAQGRQVMLVTSGAIGMGAGAIGIAKQITEVRMRQACAAVGQGILMHEYRQAFAGYGQEVAQVLLTGDVMSARRSYVNLKNAVETLLTLGVVPIINENDSVAVDELDLISFGDNDTLSALVASKIDAELLILLTDVDGLYDKNPREHPGAQLVDVVYEVTDEIEVMAGRAGSRFATGGMVSKINAIKIAANGGCKVVLANGRAKNVIGRIVAGKEIGTLFLPRRRLSNRKRWILNSQSQGRILIDRGADEAMRNKRSLLLVGIVGVEGAFDKGDVVEVGNVGKGVSDVSSNELLDLITKQPHTTETGNTKRRAIVHVNDLVLF